MTEPQENILEEIRLWNEREDIQDKQHLESELKEFNKLYLKNFDNPLCREANTMVIEHIKNELEAVNAELYGHKAGERSIRYRLEGNTAEEGQAGH